MKYWVRTVLGLAIIGGSLVLVNWALYHLVRTGTCASGGPYVSARQCPEGTGLKMMSIFGALVAGGVGLGIFATRGGGNRAAGSVGVGILSWSLGFITMGATSLVAGFGPAANDLPGSKLGAGIVGGIFIPMGLIPLLVAGGGVMAWGRRGSSAGRPPVPGQATAPAASTYRVLPTPPPRPASTTAGASGGDPLDQLTELARLRESGVLTEAEFQAQKAKILGQM